MIQDRIPETITVHVMNLPTAPAILVDVPTIVATVQRAAAYIRDEDGLQSGAEREALGEELPKLAKLLDDALTAITLETIERRRKTERALWLADAFGALVAALSAKVDASPMPDFDNVDATHQWLSELAALIFRSMRTETLARMLPPAEPRTRSVAMSGTTTKRPDVDAFLALIVQLSKDCGLSLSHEDAHGAFLVGRYNPGDTKWLQDAAVVE